MLGSISTKDGIVLYHIKYGTFIGCPTINGVTSCGQPKCWLTNVRLVTKPGCIWFCCIGTPTRVASVFGTTVCKEVLNSSFINLFNLSSTKGQFLNSCPTCWQNAQVNATSTVGWVGITSIFR